MKFTINELPSKKWNNSRIVTFLQSLTIIVNSVTHGDNYTLARHIFLKNDSCIAHDQLAHSVYYNKLKQVK